MKYLISLLFLTMFMSVVHASPEHPDTCTNYGGRIDLCLEKLDRFPNHGAIGPGYYYSAATWVLAKASCVSPNSVFLFHSAYDSHYRMVEYENDRQRRILSGLPNMLSYLEANGAFTRIQPHVVLTGPQIAAMEPRIRLCSR
jgi:hypothetical protein